MKRLFILVLVLLGFGAKAQNFDSVMVKHQQLDCSDVTINSASYFTYYVENNKIDSANMILDYWQNKCGNTEPIFRAKILLYIIEGKSIEPLIDSSTIDNIFVFKNRILYTKSKQYNNFEYYQIYYGHLPFNSDFDFFTKKKAFELLYTTNNLSLENLFCEFYSESNDSIFYKLQGKEFKDTELRKSYDKIIKYYYEKPNLIMNLSAGAWIPTGSMSKFGVKPNFGIEYGIEYKDMYYGISMLVRGEKSNVSYLARRTRNSPIEKTNDFMGVYVGFEAAKTIFKTNKTAFKIQIGLGYEGITAFADENVNDNTNTSVTIDSYNFNIGFKYQFYFKNNNYIGIYPRYNFVNYRMSNVVNFSSNPISVQLIYGFGYGNHIRNNAYNNLDYLGPRH